MRSVLVRRAGGSRKAWGVALGAAILVQVTSASALRAQIATAERAQPAAGARRPHARELLQLRARIDSLTVPLEAYARRDSLVQDSIARAYMKKHYVRPDTVEVGPFTIAGSPADVRRSTSAFRSAWDRMSPMFRGMEDDIQGVMFRLVEPGTTAMDSAKQYVIPLYHYIGDPGTHALAEIALGRVVTARLPASVREWLIGGGVGTATNTHAVRRSIAFAGRTSHTSEAEQGRSTNRCARGVLEDCRALLSLSDQPVQYADAIIRASFLTHVVLHAPPGSVARSTTDSSDVIHALEHLGGAPLDTLVSRWLDDVTNGGPGGFADTARYGLATIFWVGVFGALAMRSTRWRLG